MGEKLARGPHALRAHAPFAKKIPFLASGAGEWGFGEWRMAAKVAHSGWVTLPCRGPPRWVTLVGHLWVTYVWPFRWVTSVPLFENSFSCIMKFLLRAPCLSLARPTRDQFCFWSCCREANGICERTYATFIPQINSHRIDGVTELFSMFKNK